MPCASATSELEIIWLRRKPRFKLPSLRRRVDRYATRVATIAARPQTNGATNAGTITFDASPLQSTPAVPSATSTDPITPPTSACEDEDGIPAYHVITFQTIAPISPAKITGTVIMP